MQLGVQKIIFSTDPNCDPFLPVLTLFLGVIGAIGAVLMVVINLICWKIYQKVGRKFSKFLLLIFVLLFICGVVVWIIYDLFF